MKCPNCGGTNGKTNKYCRECGTRLDVLAASHDPAEVHADEVGLGEELFKVIELFESGDLDAALEKGVKLAENNSGSASAHSIVALVYERKAEQELTDGDPDRSHHFLKLAIDHYEELIDLNPDSAADREKLAALRLKYTGHVAPPVEDDERFEFRRVMRAVPMPAWIAFGVFIVVLFLVVFLTAPPQAKPQPTAKVQHLDAPVVAVTPTEPSDPGLKVYTFPQSTSAPETAPTTVPSRMPVPSVNVPSSHITLPEVRPAHVPKIDQELSLVVEPPKSSPKKTPAEPSKSADKPAAGKESAGPSGGSMLAQAIRLHDQGKISEAIGAANQAVVLYQADLDAGKNVEVASRGIKNAHKLISVWQESANDTGM